MIDYYLIVAHDTNLGIGIDNGLPWRIKDDMAHFKTITTGNVFEFHDKNNVVIMGRKTWDSIPDKFRPLDNRYNIVISSQTREELDLPKDVYVAKSFEYALFIANELSPDEVYVIGGSSIYEQAIPGCTGMFITEVAGNDVECDSFFPDYREDFEESTIQKEGSQGSLTYKMSYYCKKKTI
jgi:dihydrofolate reductase